MNDGKQCLGCEQEIGVCKMSDCLAKGNENYSKLEIYYNVEKLKGQCKTICIYLLN